MQKIFITGGCGFIGSHLIKRLITKGYSVKIFDNLHRNAIQYTDLLNNTKVEFVKGDIMDAQHVTDAMQGCDLVIHMAAIAGVSDYYLNPSRTLQVNLIGTFYVLEAVKKNKINRLIDMSSSEVLGTEVIGSDEESYLRIGPPRDKRWSYSVGKLAGEQLIYRYSEELGWKSTIIRLFNIYGPHQVGESAVSNFCSRALKGEDLVIDGVGSSLRSWCYISDFVDAVMCFVEKPNDEVEIFNVGDPWTTISNLHLAKMIITLARDDASVKKKPTITFRPMPFTDIKARYPDVGKMMQTYNWKPEITIEDGVRETYKWFRETFK
ncbi:MAG: NAD(P)-dependent oxidoreductase [Bacteroidales bacterium]|nr:NAD(P)-dependent oxidoreductase [Bacteroidales bacterium]